MRVTDDAGAYWTTSAGRGLPVLDVATYRSRQDNTPVGLTVVNAQVAVARIGSTKEYVTTNAGASWSPLTPNTLEGRAPQDRR